jgi:catechol 2,3-dioxygenase-like lactoylglutathione lyase family enzyme
MFATLIEDFERGKLTRRQLIHSLAAVATATSAASSTSAAWAQANPLRAVSVHHISYRVPDYKKTCQFYADLFGMKLTGDTGKQCSLVFGDSVLIARLGSATDKTPLVDHIAYTVDSSDKNAVEAELKRRGLKPRIDPEDSFHVEDPDGYHVQINLAPARK